MITVKSSLFLLLLLGTAASLNADAPELWGGLEEGAHGVGFRLIEETDFTRAGSRRTATGRCAVRGRPLRIYLWYPAAKHAGPPMPFGAYADLAAGDFGGVDRKEAGTERIDSALPIAHGFPPGRLARLLDSPAAAVRDAAPLEGPFPVVVLGQGLYYESPVTHAVLCEFLAGHGFVVATCPLAGTRSRLVNIDTVDLDTQVRDMEFVTAAACRMPFTDDRSIGAAGFDLGGMSALVLQMRNPDVKALATIDAGVLFGHPSGLPGSSPHYDVNRLDVPWIHLTRGAAVAANGPLLETSSLFAAARFSDRYLLWIEGTEHMDFTSYALMEPELPVRAYWGPPHDGRKPACRLVCRYVLEFFNAFLKDDHGGQEFLKKDPEDVDTGGVTYHIKRKKGPPPPPTIDDFVNAVLEHGAGAAVRMVRHARPENESAHSFSEETLNFIGYKLLNFWRRPADAVLVFELNVELHPDSANVYDSLGEAYYLGGKKDKAIESYSRSLELDPSSENAKTMLERLKDK